MKTHRRKAVAAAAGALALLALVGCSGETAQEESSQGGSDLSKAETVLEEAQAEITDGQIPESSPAIAEDKLVVAIPCSYAAEGCKRGADGVEEAAKELGWKYQLIDPAGDPEQMRQAVRTAIQLGVDDIFLGATPAEVVGSEIKEAQEAGIQVINMYEPAPDDFADGSSMSDHYQAGYWNAAYVAVATGGTGKVVTINDPEFQSVTTWHRGFTEGLAELCPDCTVVKNIDFQIANLQTQVPTEFQAVLQANPDIDAVWAAYDPVYAAIQPVIERSSNPDIVVVSHNGDAFALEDLKSGDTPLGATVGYNIEWQAYAGVDQMNRLFAGGLDPELRDYVVPQKLFVQDNVTSIPWDGDYDWKSAYLDIWKNAS